MSSSTPPESRPSPIAGERGSREALLSDELLPPVEAPSARFILQLFVVPAVIVAAVVLFWMVIESLARRSEQDPDEIVRALRSSSPVRFQTANDLADMLRLPDRYPKLKRNRELVQKLAALLDEQIEAGDDGDASITMRMFLCKALGEFYVDDSLPTLLKAARSDPDRDVRRQAINAMAVLAGELSNLKPPQYLESDELVDTLVALGDDPDELIRSETAFALGVAATAPKADPRLALELEELADDPYTDARFNAAVALARIGHPRAAAGIAEMLDAESIASSLQGEKPMVEDVSEQVLRSQKAYKRDSIINSAISAIYLLLKQGPLPPDAQAALDRALSDFIVQAPKIKAETPIPRELVKAAEKALAKVREPRAASASSH